MKLFVLSLFIVFSFTSSGIDLKKNSSGLSNFKVGGAKASFYSSSFLTSRFSSWGINPENGLAAINLDNAWKNFKKNKDVVVAVVDTGIQYSHPFLKDNLISINGKVSPTNYGVDFSGTKMTTAPNDTHGHGTHVAGIVKSIFPDVKILALKYYNPHASGQANLDSTIKALEYAVDMNVDIINYSGGGPEASKEELAVLQKAQKKGILIIAAAGNERSNIDLKRNAYFPASYGLDNIISVGAHNESVKIIESSNWGSKSVDIAAPGYKIKSSIPTNGAGYMTGTSQATAFVTGVVSMIKSQYPQLNYGQIRNIILSSSLKIKRLEGKILGGGKLDADKALSLAGNVSKALAKRFQNKKSGRSVAKKR